MDKVLSDKRIIALYVLPSLLLVLGLIYIPIVLTGYYGLTKWDGIGAKQFIGLDNYLELMGDRLFWSSAFHSLLLAVFSALSLLVYLAVALLLAGRIKGSNLLRKIYLVPMLLSSVAIAQLWLKIYHPTNGILTGALEFIGFTNTPAWLAEPAYVLPALFVPILWQYAGFYILIYYSALKNIPSSLEEAARIDGANPLQYFDLIYVMTNGGPNGASEVMASYMYRIAFKGFNFGYGSAIGFFLLLICLVVTWLIRKWTAAKETIEYS
ncbi:MAG: sugar transporter permease [Paenibacillaceae bacterium]|nr:sugar transporter permease [Paenibacillaceae bacterium]